MSTKKGLLNLNSEENIAKYKHVGTVVIKGDLERYIQSLERYFSEKMYDILRNINITKKELEEIESISIQSDKVDLDSWQEKHAAQMLDKNECESIADLESRLNQGLDTYKKLFSAQRFNMSIINKILKKEEDIKNLDIINYAYANYHISTYANPDIINRIRYGFKKDAILIQVFHNPGEIVDGYKKPLKSIEGYAQYVKNIGLDSSIIPTGTNAKITTLEEYTKQNHIQKKRIKPRSNKQMPIIFYEDKIFYNIFLNEHEVDILQNFIWKRGENIDTCSREIENIQVESGMSEDISKSALRRLYGILAISQSTQWMFKSYKGFYIPEENKEALIKVLAEGEIFRKYITEEQIPVLTAIYNRTKELQEKYGSRFYPQFTIRESAYRTNISMSEAKKHLTAMTGLLTKVSESHIFETTRKTSSNDDYRYRTYSGVVSKWFISRARMPLVERIIEST